MEEHSPPSRQPMTYVSVVAALATRPDWALVDGALVRTHDCGGWDTAFAALGRIAHAATDLDHHPDWSQRGGVVRVEVRTHRPAGVSALDLALVDAVDEVLGAVDG